MRELLIFLDVTPRTKPRMTQRDRWKKRPRAEAYFAYRDEVRLMARGWAPPECDYWIVFTMPMPSSWSKKKRAELAGQPHQQTPDKDNLEKAFLDCFGEDKRVWDGRVTKIWGERGAIDVYRTLEMVEVML